MFNALATLIATFFSICQFRLAPQDLPSSHFLLRTVLVLFFVLGFMINSLWLPLPLAALIELVGVTFTVAFTMIALQMLNLRIRTTQTLSAQAGAGATLRLIALPLLAWEAALAPSADEMNIAVILEYVLIVWSMLIQGHIFRHAFSCNWTMGVVLALLSYGMQRILLSTVLRSLLHP